MAFDADEVDVDCGGDQLVISTSGWGRRRGVAETLQILADAGFTGQVTCEDECSKRWRHRIGDDGQVRLDDATTVYSGGPISEVWIVQMQSPGRRRTRSRRRGRGRMRMPRRSSQAGSEMTCALSSPSESWINRASTSRARTSRFSGGGPRSAA